MPVRNRTLSDSVPWRQKKKVLLLQFDSPRLGPTRSSIESKRLRSCCSPIRSDSILPRTKRLRYYSSLIRSNLIRFGPPAAKEAALLLHFNSIRSSYRQKGSFPCYFFHSIRFLDGKKGRRTASVRSVRFGPLSAKKTTLLLQFDSALKRKNSSFRCSASILFRPLSAKKKSAATYI